MRLLLGVHVDVSVFPLEDNLVTFLVAQLVENPPAVEETPFQFLGWEDPLRKG